MDYQNKKYRQYRQCGICAQKNSTVQVARTSSDLYIYDSPSFIMTTANKINQNELTFDLSGISYNSLYTAFEARYQMPYARQAEFGEVIIKSDINHSSRRKRRRRNQSA
jgi:hypothetical protein